MPEPVTIPDQVRAAREAQGLTQADLAERAGLTRKATITDLEGGANVTLETLHRVAAGLGLPLSVEPDAPLPEVRPNLRGRKRARKKK